MLSSAAVRTFSLPLLLLLLLMPVNSLNQNYENLKEQYECPRGNLWSLMRIALDFGERSEVSCYSVGSARSYQAALRHCHNQQARLLAPTTPLSSYPTPSGATVLDLLFQNGVQNFWYGFHVTSGRLTEDTFPMTQRRAFNFELIASRSIPWLQNTSFPMHSEPRGVSPCFQMTLNLSLTCPPGDFPLDLNGEINPGTTISSNTDQPGGLAKRSVRGIQKKDRSAQDIFSSSLGLERGEAGELDGRRRRERLREGRGLLWNSSADYGKVRAKRQTPTETPCDNQRAWVSSRDCQDSLPFVCVKPAVRKRAVFLTQLDTLCQPGEFGHVQFPRCFSFGEGNVNRSAAEAACGAMGQDRRRPRTLYRPGGQAASSSSSFLDDRIVEAVTRTLRNRKQTVTWQNSLAWVGGGGEEGRGCLALSLNTSDILSWDCSALLPFHICQGAVAMPEVSELEIEVIHPTEDQPYHIANISGTRDRQVSIPSIPTELNSRAPPSLSCLYNASLVPQLQSLTLVKRGIPEAQRNPTSSSGPLRRAALEGGAWRTRLTVPLRNIVDTSGNSSARNLTDYYWCEVNDLSSGKVFRSGRVFLRTWGVEMYAASIAMEARQYPRPQLILRSLLGNEDTVGSLPQALPLGNFDYRVLRFRPQLTPPGSNRTVVDLHLFNKTLTSQGVKVTSGRLQAARRYLRSRVQSFQQYELPLMYGFDPQSLQVRSIDICPSTSVYDPVSEKTYEIPDTDLGDVYTSSDICLSNGEPYVRLACKGDKLFGADWSEFSPTSGCRYSNADRCQTGITAELKTIAESDISEQSVDEVLVNTTEAVTAIDSFAAVDLVYLADILQQSTGLTNLSLQNGQKILALVDRAVRTSPAVLKQSNSLGNATNRLLRAVDQLGDKLVLEGGVSTVRVVADSTAVEVWDLSRVTGGDVIVGLELLLEGGEPVPVLRPQDLVSLFDTFQPSYTQTDAAILLPGAFVRELQRKNSGREVRLAMNVFASTALFQLGRLERSPDRFAANATLNSKVIAAKVTVSGTPVTNLDGYTITTVYLPVQTLPAGSHAGNSTCVFWDFGGARGQGSWSADGCRYLSSQRGRDVCVCDHLTNFAVLLDVYGQSALPQEQQLALSVITIVGLSLSIAGLTCTVLSFLLIKKLRQGRPQQTLFNMAVAMLASWIVFLAGFTRTEDAVGCVLVAILLHYLVLASFMWMLMEAVLQYMLFVRVLGNDFGHYLVKTALPAWGLPLIPVIVVLAIDTDMYRGGDKYCWMALTPFYYSFLAPVAVIMLVNAVVYVLVVVSICRRGNVGSSSSSSSKRAVGIRASVACFVALGLSWMFAFFAIEDARVVFQYLFTLTASLQGFLIFLIFTARDPNVRAFWSHACCSWLKRRKANTAATTSSKSAKSSGSDPLGGSRPKDGGGLLGGGTSAADMPMTSSEQSSGSSFDSGSQSAASQRTTGSPLPSTMSES